MNKGQLIKDFGCCLLSDFGIVILYILSHREIRELDIALSL